MSNPQMTAELRSLSHSVGMAECYLRSALETAQRLATARGAGADLHSRLIQVLGNLYTALGTTTAALGPVRAEVETAEKGEQS